MLMWNYNFYVYITTDTHKTALYVGVTNDISVRVIQRMENRETRKPMPESIIAIN